MAPAGDAAPPDPPACTLLVCVTCRAGRALAEGEAPPGRILHDALAGHLGALATAPVSLRPVTCLAACDRGCAAVLAAPGKWSYLLGHLSPALAGDLIAYGAAYAAHASGAVLPSRRPASLRSVVLGRIPALPPADPSPAAIPAR
ncbi:DUF1636 domain-containing protein [Roseomonas sp. NAR14]|uniref:DUF1636 domain-containing protein n=1 Tax=Roseomonas acroporae TaxID=2937791 RepID=A0A9X1YFD6_9PROT|nr:DUF1636 domain-containing protein [Roseomonas acroporae]MCK8785206.1 DUF1636 domain-containing protein [Roseomonas acroporae]